MKTYINKMVEQESLASVTCDICKKTFYIKDTIEIQEFVSIDLVGGYGSVFGDGTRVECDICQCCLNMTLGKFLRKS